MRTFILLCCTTVLGFSNNTLFSQDAKVNIDTDKIVTIFEVFELIGKQTECTFIYQSDIFKDVPQIQLKSGVIKVMTLLSQCLPVRDFQISSDKNNLITISRKPSNNSPLQDIEVKGVIKESNGLPLAGVTIIIKGTNRGTTSDFDGNYVISANSDDILIISHLGYTTLTIPIQNRSTINVTLQEDATTLGEVQINAGYYSTTDREKTGSIARITAKEIEKQPVNNPLGAMQGYMSGVNIVQKTGVPGGGYDIQIRGKNFINGSTEPLFIIDGVPFSSHSLSSNDVSGQIFSGVISPLNAIDPKNIKNIEVLKDADATAIYGSRGANGVVLITTKGGNRGRTQFTLNISNTLGRVSNFLELMNTTQYLETRIEGVTNDGYAPYLETPAFDFFWPDIKSWDITRSTDWQKELIGGTANQNRIHLSVSGGSQRTQFLISGSNHKETTVFPGDANYRKTSVHNSLNHESHDERFKIHLSTTYTNENNLLPRSDFSYQAYTLEPNAPKLFDDAGKLNWENNTWDNPLASLDEVYEVKINTLLSNAGISYNIFQNLLFKTSLGYNSYEIESYRTLPSSARNPQMGFTPQNYSSVTTNNSRRQAWIIEPQFNWTKKWNKTKFDILVGATFQKENIQQLLQKGKGFPNDNLILNLSAAETLEILADSNSEYSYQAFFGRFNLIFNDKYIVNLTGRRDGSSRFGPGKQFGNFGAIGLAWIFTEENIFKGTSFISFGKLRGSYGITGSDNIGDYKFLNTYKVLGQDYNDVTILEPSGIFNPLFGWEENKKFEVAVELGFFNDRIFMNFSWYRNRSSNQLIGIPLAATTGFSELNGNFDATVENTGFELDFRTLSIESENFKWNTTFNISIPRNELLKFDGLDNSTFANRLVIGKPLTIVKLYKSLGVNPETGLYHFEDYNNDGTISRPEDRNWIDNFAPKFYGGFSNTFSYKNLTLEVFFQFKKQRAFNNLRWRATPGFRGNGPVSLLDRWQQEGDINPVQMASGGLSPIVGPSDFNQSESSAAVSDASFLRLRNVSLNYLVPVKTGLDINVYLQGQNLLTFSKYTGPDPEQPLSTRLPALRQVSIGAQLKF